MSKGNKYCKIFISVFAALLCIICLCSCRKKYNSIFNPDRITEIYFVSFTEPGNTLYMDEDNLGSKWRPLLKKKEALELAHAVEAIPDPVSSEGANSFIIRISYVEDGVEKYVEKNGYNTFPDNWDSVVELTNIVAGDYDHVTNSRELAVIDAEYLRSHNCISDESIIPEGMTLDEVIEGAHITYLTLYDPTTYEVQSSRVKRVITDYLYDYFDLYSHQIDKLDANPAKSSKEELEEFADSRLDEFAWNDDADYSCYGKYNGLDYKIIRYDMVQTWLAKESEYYDRCVFSGTPCEYQTEIHWEFAAGYYDSWDVFVDGSGRFLILTHCNRPGDIATVVK